jgi:hypothetical protein
MQLMLFVIMVLKGRTTCAAVCELLPGGPREKMRIFNRYLEADPHFEAEWLRVLNSIRGFRWSEEDHAQHRAYMAVNEPAFQELWGITRGLAEA